MKTGKKLGIWLLVCSLILTGLTFIGEKAYAAPTASFSVSAGGSASLGGSVSVTVSVNGSENMAFAQVSLNYSSNILEYQSGADSGGSGRVNLLFDCGSGQKSVSRTITFKAVGTGKASLTLDSAKATPMDANSGDWMNASVAGGASVTVGEAKNLSADAHVASIEVSPGTLNPAFNTNVFKYTMEVENSVTSIAVTAKASNAAAKITAVNGATNLKVGTNKVTIICTAENGGTASYTITVTRKAAGAEQPQTTTKPAEEATTAAPAQEITCELNGATYYVGQDFKEDATPEGFQTAQIQYQGQTIKGGQFANNNEIQLLYLLDGEKKNGQFYLYYPTSGLIGELVRVSFYEGSYIYLIDPTSFGAEIPIDLEETVFTVDDRELKGYQLAAPKEGVGDPLANEEDGYILERVSANPTQFVLLYGLNKDGGICWYSYDTQEKTLQRFVSFASEEEEEVVETVSDGSENAVKKMLTTVKIYRIILLGAAAIILLLILLCVLLAVNGRKKKNEDEDYDDEDDFEEEDEEFEIKKGFLKVENVEATKGIPAKEIREKAEKSEAEEPKTEKKPVSEKSHEAETKQKTKKEAHRDEKPDAETPEKPNAKIPEKPDAETAEKTDDLGLEFFDIDDL